MYYILRILLGILAILIAVFQVKAYKYNIRNRNLIIASLRKDIRPYWLLWGFWLILFLFMLFFKGISVNGWGYVSDRFEDVKGAIINNNADNDQKHKPISKNNIGNDKVEILTGGNDNSSNVRRGIITEEQVQQISDRSNMEIIPITDGYYEIISSDGILLPDFIDTSRYVLPPSISSNYCPAENTYRNLWGKLGLNYNGFIYEYINSHKKNDILVAILDSGIDGDNTTLKGHIAINSGEVQDGKDTDGDGYIDDVAGVNVALKNGNIEDYNGHGTHVAGIVLQTFPNASILPIKLTEGDSEYVDEYNIIKGLRYAIDAGVDIINMSFGGKGFNEVTQALIQEANDKGILVIAAAGNEGDDIFLYYPASYTGVVNVGSLGFTGISSFSNYIADVLAPGECIYSYGLDNPFEFWGGTSMSSPHIAGILGTYLSLGNNLSGESEALNALSKAIKTKDGIKVVDMPKFIGIEKNNDNLYSYIGKIKSTLESIQTKLNKLQNSSFTESDLNSVASNKSTLSSSAANIGSLYSKLQMTTGFGLELKKDIEEYNKLLGTLNLGGLYLEVDGGTLSSSLGVSTCDPYPTCNIFSRIINKGSSLPNNSYRTYYTTYDNQNAVEFKIYQGDNNIADMNTYLGKITVYGLPSKLAGEAGATVYFDVNANGKLSVRAVDKDNSNNVMRTTINSVKRNTVVMTGENYYKAKSTMAELLTKTEETLSKIQNFYNLNPFDYIPESVTGSYEIAKIDLDIPEYIDVSTGIDVQSDTGIESQYNTGITIETGVNLSGIVSIFSGIKSKLNLNENIKVDSVIDGDTIRVFMNGKSVKVRLIGVDAPESTDTRYGYTECFGNESTNYLKNLLSNKTIGLEYDLTQGMYDKYDRVLAYVFLNGENINKKIIEDGYGREYTYNLPYKYQKEFKSAQRNAESLNKGLWDMSTCEGDRKPNY